MNASHATLIAAVTLGCLCRGGWGGEALESKPRLVILTDIGGDPDDQQSLIRLMTYANQFDIEALIASAAGTPGELNDRVTRPDIIRAIVAAYGHVRDNLAVHAEGYPTAEHLLARIQAGNPQRGPSAIGQGRDTQASAWIISVVDKPDPRPVNIAIWGGQTDLAQAAVVGAARIEAAGGLNEFLRRIRVYDIGDQDGIVEWIWSEFPGMFYVLGQAPPGRDMRDAVYRGMYLGGDQSLTSRGGSRPTSGRITARWGHSIPTAPGRPPILIPPSRREIHPRGSSSCPTASAIRTIRNGAGGAGGSPKPAIVFTATRRTRCRPLRTPAARCGDGETLSSEISRPAWTGA